MAVSKDIDPDNGDAVFWSLAYRANPAEDVEILRVLSLTQSGGRPAASAETASSAPGRPGESGRAA